MFMVETRLKGKNFFFISFEDVVKNEGKIPGQLDLIISIDLNAHYIHV